MADNQPPESTEQILEEKHKKKKEEASSIRSKLYAGNWKPVSK